MFPHQCFCQILLLATLWHVHHYISYEPAFSRDVECFMFFHFLCQWREGAGNSSNNQLLLPPLPVSKEDVKLLYVNHLKFSLCVPRRDRQSLVLCLLLWPTLSVEGVGVFSFVYSSYDLCFCEGMGSSFPVFCLCWREENVFFSFLLCFGEGIRYFFRLFLQSCWRGGDIFKSPCSASCVFVKWMVSSSFVSLFYFFCLYWMDGDGISCVPLSLLKGQGRILSPLLSLLKGWWRFHFSFQPPLFAEVMGTLYVFFCIFWKPVIFNQGTHYS